MKTRFSPSPSGFLHVGGARSAAFNWFLAKQNKGCFLVRIEDTDQKRSSIESENIILDSLRWLGLDWQEGLGIGGDNGPYRQSERTDIYKYYAEKLINEGKAYRCYCTQEELDAKRAAIVKENPKAQFKYPNTCRNRKDTPDKKFVIRFKAPTDGVIEYTDMVFGKIRVPNIENQDFVIMKSDGQGMYNFAAAIDDRLMGISNIVRGREHMVNTPLQILIFQAFGWDYPQIASLPLMLDQSGAKLSKRTNSVSVFEYRDAGFAPGAVLNYLCRFGWSHGNQEIFSTNELIEKFSLEACGKNDGKFDPKKFSVINYEHLKTQSLVSDEEYSHRLLPFLHKNGLADITAKQAETVIPLIRSRSKTFVEAANDLDPILRKYIAIDKDAADKILTPDAKVKLNHYVSMLKHFNNWNADALRSDTQNWLSENGMSLKDIGQPTRVAITGRTNSPELFQVMAALGKDATIDRISKQAKV